MIGDASIIVNSLLQKITAIKDILQEIGCDLELRTGVKLDKCGVCGGNGSSCSDERYIWEKKSLSRCSVSCGGGQKMIQYTCKDKNYNKTIANGFCDQDARPMGLFVACNEEACPSRYGEDKLMFL